MKTTLLAIVAMMALATTQAFTAENNEKSCKAQMTAMAKELESNDPKVIKAFILKYALSEDMKKMLTEEKIDALVPRFMKRKKGDLQKHLAAAATLTPTISADKLSYTFSAEDDATKAMRKKITLVYSEKTKLFHIKN